MIALAIAIAAAVAGMLTLGVLAIAANRRAGDEKSGRAELAVRLEVAIANSKTQSARADDEKKRADALDDLFAETAVNRPVDGSYDWLLQAWAAIRAAHRDGARALPTPAAAPSPGPDDLLRPGE